jgi:hypothetical protein
MTENLKEIKSQEIKIAGILTSQIQLREKETQEPYYYSFIRLKNQTIDLPVIFKIKDNQETKLVGHYDPTKRQCYMCLAKLNSQEEVWCSPCKEKRLAKDKGLIKPTLKKSDQVELTGYYSTSEKSVRKSFTAISYQILNERSLDSFDKLSEKRIRKKCLGCLDLFTCLQFKNYDYCSSCSLNESRYLNKDSPCSECDGSGLIKFSNQPPRNCKTCYLARQEKSEEKTFAK